MKEAAINSNQALIAHYQATKIRQTRESSFDFPPLSVASELFSILQLRLRAVLTVWNDQINLKRFKPLSKWIAVIAFIGNQSQRALFGATAAISWHL